MTLGEKIYEQRKKANISQEELAFKLNVTRQSISLWETNQATPSLDNLVKLSEIFNISMDELCGKESQKENTNELLKERTNYFGKSSFCYTENIYNNINKLEYKKSFLLLYISIGLAILFIIVKLINPKSNSAIAMIPIFIGFFAVLIIIKYKKNIKKSVEITMKLKPNAKNELYFYEEFFEIESSSDNSKATYHKKYSEIVSKKLIDGYIYIKMAGLYTVININNFEGDLEKLKLLLCLKEDKKSNLNKGIKVTLLIFFIISFASILMALATSAILIETSIIPEFPLTITEYMWVFFCFIPLPLTSLILGIIFTLKGYKCKKNIIGGSIMIGLLSIYGSFTQYFSIQISHDYDYIEKITQITQINFPDQGYISISLNESENINTMAMVRFDETQVDDFISSLDLDKWKTTTSSMPIDVVDLYYAFYTRDFDYFCLYDVVCEEFNSINNNHQTHELIYMAYDVDNNLLVILSFIVE